MSDSILISIKKLLNLHEDDTSFDLDVLLHINSAFSTLHQLGVGPENGFAVVDATSTWTSFIGTDDRYNSVKTYVYLKVRLVFDSMSLTGPQISAYERYASELEWRLNIVFEGDHWVDPDPDPNPNPSEPSVIDGGAP